MFSAGGVLSFLATLNFSLQSKDVPPIRITDLMTLASKEVLSVNTFPSRGRLSDFFEQLSAISEDEHVLAILKTVHEYAQTRDHGVLRQLPIEERQLIEEFVNSLANDVKSKTADDGEK